MQLEKLQQAIAGIIETAPASLSEYQLITMLNQQGWEFSLDAAKPLVMFKSHFLVSHVLYTLQQSYWQNAKRFLDISALSIGFVNNDFVDDIPNPSNQGKANGQGLKETSPNYENQQKLRDYYLDLGNLEQATESSVNDLLAQFWQRYLAEDEKPKALAILQFEVEPNADILKQKYRQLAMQHHPDRGGDAGKFQQINWAYGVLQQAIN